jgi:hypothetical protein
VTTHAHDWIEVPDGSALTDGVAFKFCSVCDAEVWASGIMRPGSDDDVPEPIREILDLVEGDDE